MSTRSPDRPPQGAAPDVRKTTQQSMIAAIGASGAVIAGGVTTFVLLVGVVSFDVWPMSDQPRPGPGSGLRVVELPSEPGPTVVAPAGSVPFGSGVLATEPTLVTLDEPEREPDPAPDRERPKRRGDLDEQPGAPPAPIPVAQAPGSEPEEVPGGGGTVGAGAEEPIPQEEPPAEEPESDGDDSDGRPQRPSRPTRPAPAAPAAPPPSPVTSSGPTAPSGGGPSSGGGAASGGAGGANSGGNGNHGGRG